MIQELDSIAGKALNDIEGASSLSDLEDIRVKILGKKGSLSQVLKGMGGLSAEERPKVGQAANQWKGKLENAITDRRSDLEGAALSDQIKNENIDISLPSRKEFVGHLHPLTQTMRKIIQVLERIGFDVTTGPETDTDFMNFEAANIPKDHPARDMQDTFFLGPDVVLRTHTTTVQMRSMRERKWPLRILCPGAVYRCDSDATHSPMFHQVEGLWVDKNVKMSDLVGVLDFFAKEIFGSQTKIRLRPSFFPFVEPGCEMDVSWGKDKDGNEKWMEILGAGMVHPRLFETAGYDPNEVTGFAFGVGIERVAMLLHGIQDIRRFYSGDMRFLRQF